MLVPNTGVIWRVYRDTQQAVRASGPVVVASAGLPEDQQTPMVPNVPETYRMAGATLALLIGGLVVVLADRKQQRRSMQGTHPLSGDSPPTQQPH